MPRTSGVAGATKKNGAAAAAAAASLAKTQSANLNGSEALQLQELLHALQAMRVGDFSVRMAGHQIGVMGKVADTFNEIVAANQRMAKQLERVGQVVGREGKTRQRVRFGLSEGAWGEIGIFRQLADRRSPVADDGSHAGYCRGRAGRSSPDGCARRRWPAVAGRVPPFGRNRQHDDQAAQRVHLGGDARRPRSRHRGQARRSGAGARSDRRVEGSHRERQLDGLEPHRPGSQHRRGDDRGGERRPVEEDHRRRPRRNSAAQGSHQYDGRSAALLRVGSHPRRPRSRHRRQARRPGDRARRCRHLEGFDQLGQRHVRQPHRSGAQHRARDHGGGPRRPVAQDHRRRARRNS